MTGLSRAWATPLTVIGIILIVLAVMQIPNSIVLLFAVLNTAEQNSDFTNGELVGAITSNVVFLLIGVFVLVKGRQIRNRNRQSESPGTGSSAV